MAYEWIFGHRSHQLMDDLLDPDPPADEAALLRHLAYYNDGQMAVPGRASEGRLSASSCGPGRSWFRKPTSIAAMSDNARHDVLVHHLLQSCSGRNLDELIEKGYFERTRSGFLEAMGLTGHG